MATVLKFDKPANLNARTLDTHNNVQIYGTPLSAYTFSDFDASEYGYRLMIFPVGEAFGAKRHELEEFMLQVQEKTKKAGREPDVGTFDIGGKKVLRLFLGFGAGGEGTGILFRHSTEPIEILVIQSIAYREPPYPNDRKPDARPTVPYYEAVREIEKLVEIR
jgi:hypothetical protein